MTSDNNKGVSLQLRRLIVLSIMCLPALKKNISHGVADKCIFIEEISVASLGGEKKKHFSGNNVAKPVIVGAI